MNQLSLFAPQFDERIRRIEIEGKTFFSVLDVFQHYGKAKNPTTSWRTAINRLEKQGFDRSREILDRPIETGGRPTPFTTFQTMLRIAQVTDFAEWESIRTWMAEVAHERLEEIANPALGIDRAEKRFVKAQVAMGVSEEQAHANMRDRRNGMEEFKRLTSVVQRVASDKPNYGRLVNVEYRAIFGMIASELEAILQTKSIRDSLPRLAYLHVCTAEEEVRILLERCDAGAIPFNEVCNIMRKIAEPLGAHLANACQLLNIDPITGKPLLGSGN